MAATDKVQETMGMDLADMLDAEDGAMVTLVAGETRLLAHRAVLADRSPVFAAMFRHDTLEASSGQVSIPDVAGPVLRQLLAYMYSLRVPQLPGMAPQLLAAADKYGVPGLKIACERQVTAQLSVETAAAAAALAVRHSCDSLRQAAITFIKEHLVQVMATQSWADAIRSQPEDAVEVSQLLAEPPTETSTTGSSPAPASNTSLGSQTLSDLGQPPTTAVPPSTAQHSPTPDDEAVLRMRNLSGYEKSERLFQAAKEGNVQELQALLAAGADVGTGDEHSRTALHWAARRGHVEAVRSLLGGGAEVAARSSLQQATPLHFAAISGHAAVVELLAARADPDARDVNERTPLHWAAEKGHAEAASALLEAGASRATLDNKGKTPLHLARQQNHRRLVDILT